MSKFDASFFKPFVDGTINMLKVSCSTDAKPQKPFIKGTTEQQAFDIAGVIGLTSVSFNGTITLCFPGPLFLSLMSRMLGEDFKELTDELQDGVAEFLNMIFGQAKVVLNNQGHKVEMAIPTVVRGNSIKTSHIGRTKTIVLPFATDVGEFYIEICAEGTGK